MSYEPTLNYYLDILRNILEEGKPSMFSGGKKVLVDKEELMRIVDEMRDNFPDDINKAQGIMDNAAEYITDAKRRAGQIIADAETQANALIQQERIVIEAEEAARLIVRQAEDKSLDTDIAVNRYVCATLEDLEKCVADMRDTAKSQMELLLNFYGEKLDMLCANLSTVDEEHNELLSR